MPLQNGGKHITFLLDGYDELPEGLREDSFVARLIDKEELPAAAVVVSSRPHASKKIRQNASCYVDILGFAKEEQQAFIQESLKGKSEKIEELRKYLESHPNIGSLCYIPFNMVILLWLFKEGIKPKVSTELYNLFVLHTIQNSLNKFNLLSAGDFSDLNSLSTPYKEVMQQLCTLCLKTVDSKQLVFTLDDIKQFCPNLESIPGALNGFGLLQATEHTTVLGRSTKIFNFVHSSIQEYLAACQITTLSYEEELQLLRDKFWSDAFTNTLALYVGKTKGQREAFKHFLADDGLPGTIADNFLQDDRKCLRLFRYFSEANDKKLLQSISKSFYARNQISLKGPSSLSPSDLHCLMFFLSSSSNKTWLKLDLHNSHILDAGLKMLHQSLTTNAIKINAIDLRQNSLTSQVTQHIVDIVTSCVTKSLKVQFNSSLYNSDLFNHPTLERLHMCYNLSSHEEVQELFSTLTSCRCSKLKALTVHSNFIDDDTMSEIITFLQQDQLSTLDWLDIYSENLSTVGLITALSTLRKNRYNRLETLRIYCKCINEEAANEIAMFLKDDKFLKRLEIGDYSFAMAAESVRKILKSLRQNKSLTELVIFSKFFQETKQMAKNEQELINKQRNRDSKFHVLLYL